MAPRREILDSDDEDDDFSPVANPVAPPHLNERNDHDDGNSGTPRNRRAESTDPSFFRNVYDDQHVATNAQKSASSVAALSSEIVSTLSPNPPLNLSHINDQYDPSHLSSITDPVPASRRRQKRSDMKEVVDLTQVTTPGRPTPNVPADIWDFPASPEAGTGALSSSVTHTASSKKKITIKLKKTETKRKSALSSSIQSPEGHPSSGLLPALSVTQAEQTSDARSPEPRQKRRRISASAQPAPNSQEVDLLIIPRSEEKLVPDNNYVTPIDNPSSIVEDSLKARTTSLLVVPSTTMTASQKEEYRFVSLSSEVDRSHNIPNSFGQTEDLHKSSGSATIKYPTPVQYASSGRGDPHPGDYGTASSDRPKRRRHMLDSDPHSSPDIISEHVAGPSSTRKGPAEEASPCFAPSSPPPRSSRRRGKDKTALEEISSPDSAVAENERPRSRGRTKSPSGACHVHDLTAPSSSAAAKADTVADDSAEPEHLEVEEQLTTILEERPQKKTRGRKRKQAPSEAVVEEDLPDTALPYVEEEQARVEDEVTELPTEPAAKKKRGRPRKEPQSQAIVIDDDAETLQPGRDGASVPLDGADETPKPKKKRGRPKKTGAAKPAETEAVPYGDTGSVQQEEGAYSDNGNGAHISEGKTSKKANIKATSVEEEHPGALSERDSNSNLGASPMKPTTTTKDAVDDVAKENQMAEVNAKKDVGKGEAKPATPSSQLGKVQYRVGLSKKSRIAPLLKSFRK